MISKSQNASRADPKRLDFICFGGIDWRYHNRGHIDFQLMRRFAKQGKVLFINSIVMQKPKLGKSGQLLRKMVRKAKSIFSGLKHIENGFWVYSPISLPVNHISWLRPLNDMLLLFQIRLVAKKLKLHKPVVWVASPTVRNIIQRLVKSSLIYQRTDRFEDTPLVDYKSVSKDDRVLKLEADLTIYVNTDLYEQEKSQCKKALFFDHGVDFELFSSAYKKSEAPHDISSVPKPIVGYIGTVEGIKMNIDFLETIIGRLPDISFVFVGKVDMGFERLGKLKNVWLLGQKPYEQIPQYGSFFDVSIIPWYRSSWSEAANPIKLKEYFALGKPVVSTPSFSELEEYQGLIHIATSPSEFADSIVQAINCDKIEIATKMRDRVRNSSWDFKTKLILDKLSGELICVE